MIIKKSVKTGDLPKILVLPFTWLLQKTLLKHFLHICIGRLYEQKLNRYLNGHTIKTKIGETIQ